MFAGELTEAIDLHEEAILQSCDRDAEGLFPELGRLWEEFYDGPDIEPERAKRLAAELQAAVDGGRVEKRLEDAAKRLARFFLAAARQGSTIDCRSD